MTDPSASFAARAEVPDHVEFPTDTLQPQLADLINHASHDANVPASFVALPMLGSIAGAIGARYFVTISKDTATPFRQPCVLWLGTIGSPSSGKSPGMKVATDAVDRIEHAMQQLTHQERERSESNIDAWQQRKKDRTDRRQGLMKQLKSVESELRDCEKIEDAEEKRVAVEEQQKLRAEAEEGLKKLDQELMGDTKPADPKVYKFKVDDLTFETLPNRLAENPGGLLAAPPELTTLFGGFTRYRSGDSHVGGDMVRYIPFWDGASYTKDRQGNQDNRNVHISCGVLSIIGTIQPGMFTRVIQSSAKESGFFARWLWSYPPKRLREWQREKIGRYCEAVWFYNLLDDIRRVDVPENPRDVSLADGALEEWVQLHNKYQGLAYKAESELWEAFYGKVPAQCLRFALLLHVVGWHSFPPVNGENDPERFQINGRVMRDAVRLTEWFVDEQRRVYAWFMVDEDEVDEDERLRMRAWEWIKRQLGPQGHEGLRQMGLCGRDLVTARIFDDAEESKGFLEAMEREGRLVKVVPPKGRPGTKVDRYLINANYKPDPPDSAGSAGSDS